MHKRPHIRGRERRFSHVRQWRRRRHRHLHQCSWHLCSRRTGRLPLAAGSLENDRLQRDTRQTEQIQDKNSVWLACSYGGCMKTCPSHISPQNHKKKNKKTPKISLFIFYTAEHIFSPHLSLPQCVQTFTY